MATPASTTAAATKKLAAASAAKLAIERMKAEPRGRKGCTIKQAAWSRVFPSNESDKFAAAWCGKNSMFSIYFTKRSYDKTRRVLPGLQGSESCRVTGGVAIAAIRATATGIRYERHHRGRWLRVSSLMSCCSAADGLHAYSFIGHVRHCSYLVDSRKKTGNNLLNETNEERRSSDLVVGGGRKCTLRRRAASYQQQHHSTQEAEEAATAGDEIESDTRELPEEADETSYRREGEPILARPFVHIDQPTAFMRTDEQPAWLSSEQCLYSQVLFGKPIAAHPVLVAQTIHKLPHNAWPQVAVVGHSNVGKSSLLNALMHGRDVARSSRTPLPNSKQITLPKAAVVSHLPGRTRHLFTFDLGSHLSLVDLPGYGFARVKNRLKEEWAVLLEEYFSRSKQLQRVLSLIDATKGVLPLDEKLWQLLTEKNLTFQVVLTKVDCLTAQELHTCMLRVLARLQAMQHLAGVVFPFVHAVSARHHFGIRELRASLSVIASDARKKQNLRLFKKTRSLPSPERVHR